MNETIRVAACFYGGNALLPFQFGVGLALVELVVASRRAAQRRGESMETVGGFDWLAPIVDACPDLPSFHLDVLTGASAGGVVSAVLGKLLTDSADPEAVFIDAASLIVDEMDARRMQPTGSAPRALFDKSALTLQGLAAILAAEGAPAQAALEPGAEVRIPLTHIPGVPEALGHPAIDLRGVDDLQHLDVRRFDRLDYIGRPGEIVRVVDATSANPLVFGPTFVVDESLPAGHASWLRARAGLDPTIPQPVSDTSAVAGLSPAFDGGVLDNRPLGALVDAVFSRGLGVTRADERLVVALVDPDPDQLTDRYGPALSAAMADEGVLEPELADQLSALSRFIGIARHERITEDLERLVRWGQLIDLWMSSTPATTAPSPGSLRHAADWLVFGGRFARVAPADPDGGPDLLLRVAHTVARRAHEDPTRRALLSGGARIRRLLAMLSLSERLRERGFAAAADAVGREADALLAVEREALISLVDHTLDARAPELERLVMEACAGVPLPDRTLSPRADAPRRLIVRRVGPEPGSLASESNSLAGFLSAQYRGHDLVEGVTAGRRFVADLLRKLLPDGAASVRWSEHFGLDAAVHPGHAWCVARGEGRGLASCERWARWAGHHAAHTAWRGARGWDTLGREARARADLERLYPALSATGAEALRRLWHMSVTAGARGRAFSTRGRSGDHAIYRRVRGVLAPITRALLPRLLSLDGRAAASGLRLKPGRVLQFAIMGSAALVGAWTTLVVGTIAGDWPLSSILGLLALTAGVAIAPIAALWAALLLRGHLLARRLPSADPVRPPRATPPDPSPAGPPTPAQ